MGVRFLSRREFLTAATALAGLAAARPVFGQPTVPRRAAVVIGVNKTGDLPVLSAAASGADKVATWLEEEGFLVRRFLDTREPVKAMAIFDAVVDLVKLGTLEQLVVYFAGHGFARLYGEFWLLSGAPENPNEAVSLAESSELARHIGIPNVVFISDACRSFSEDPRSHRIQGSLIFPNPQSDTAQPPSDVDLFMATRVGDSAFEARLTKDAPALEGIFTSVFLKAYFQPDPDMRQKIDGKWVIPNRRLKAYLLREVTKSAQALSVPIRQIPDTRVNSDDSVYIGRVRATMATAHGPGWPGPVRPPDKPKPSPGGSEWAMNGPWASEGPFASVTPPKFDTVLKWAPAEMREPAYQASIRETQHSIQRAFADVSDPFLGRTGFVTTGARVRRVLSTRDVVTKLNPTSPADGSQVRITLANVRGATVVVQFESGSGAVLAALDGYIGHVVVDDFGVNSVSYVPAPQTDASDAYRAQRDQIAAVHATIATAARLGLFHIEGDRNARGRVARQLGDYIRFWKAIDPALGIYAAYAYANAGLLDQVRSVREYLRMDLGVDLFDVSLLAGDVGRLVRQGPVPVVPFCPLLAEGWNLLRVKNAELPEPVVAARSNVRPALWTTLTDAGVEQMSQALSGGSFAARANESITGSPDHRGAG